MTDSIKKVGDNIYYLVLDKVENCSLCGKELLEYIEQLKIPTGSRLILNTSANRCSKVCNENFLAGISQFKSIAYVVKEETATQNPWAHAMLVHTRNNNTLYCDTYDEAYNWSVSQEQNDS
mgnify:CR=1 FL=1|tara:strand:+ start:18525 stop:18887 length:363 start_codon:yes stop_codon:yes gene_type:complete